MVQSKASLIKHSFFNPSLKKTSLSFKEQEFDLAQIRCELDTFYQFYRSNKPLQKTDAISLYINYLLALLTDYYKKDYVQAELEELNLLKKEIAAALKKNAKKKDLLLLNDFSDFILSQFKEWQKIFISITALRNKLAALNTNRSRYGYSRALASHFLNYLQKSPIAKAIQDLNKFLGNQYSFIDGINLLNATREVSAYLGVILFSFRFFVHLLLLFKHLLHAVMDEDLSASKILKQELEKRGFTMANDLVWAIATLLTGFNTAMHVANSLVSPLVLAFLTFDALLFLGQWFFEANRYKQQLNALNRQKNEATLLEQEVIQRQIDVLNDNWEAQSQYYIINILGANILATCFAITMICSIPLALAGLAFLSMLGNALYNTSEKYKTYQKARIFLHREQANGLIRDDEHHQKLMQLINQECKETQIQFWKTLAFNVGGLAFIITAAVASWPVALGLTLMYAAYQIHKSYQKQCGADAKSEKQYDIYRLISSETTDEYPAASLKQS